MKWLSLLCVSALVLSACSSADKSDSNSPQAAFEQAQKFEKDERFEEAIQKYNEVKNKHPYSKYALESELKVADIQYERESYIEAQNAYQLFKDFHPKHPRIDYVTYRLAMSYFQQLPSSIDRDLSLADKAITYFDEVMNSYPKSEYVADCKDKKAATIKMLAEKEKYVADFYFKHDQYDSALLRYEYLINNYPESGLEAKALYGAAYSADRSSQPEKAQKYFALLKERFPDSREFRRAEKELKSYEK